MTHNTQLIALGVPEIRAIVIRVILRPKPGWPLRSSPVSNRYLVSLIHNAAMFSNKCNHLTIARLVRVLVMRLAYHE